MNDLPINGDGMILCWTKPVNPVAHIDGEGELISVYGSFQDCASALNCCVECIKRRCKHTLKKAKTYPFEDGSRVMYFYDWLMERSKADDLEQDEEQVRCAQDRA